VATVECSAALLVFDSAVCKVSSTLFLWTPHRKPLKVAAAAAAAAAASAAASASGDSSRA
jgi:hypothetical protein